MSIKIRLVRLHGADQRTLTKGTNRVSRLERITNVKTRRSKEVLETAKRRKLQYIGHRLRNANTYTSP